MNEKDKNKRNYGEEYQKLLAEKGYLFVNDPPAEAITEKRYTYQDYLDWPEDERVELIDGQIYYMAAPSDWHQDLLLELGTRFRNYLHGKTCRVFVAPFDVRIDLLIGNDSVVQPDVLVVCDKEKLDGRGVNGAPDFVIEILSPSTRGHDLVKKYNKYLEVAVREYWIVDPEKEEVLVNLLNHDKTQYLTTTFKKGDEISVSVLDNFIINVSDLFEGYQGDEIMEVEQRVFGIARKMLELGDGITDIMFLTSLTAKQIEELLGN